MQRLFNAERLLDRYQATRSTSSSETDSSIPDSAEIEFDEDLCSPAAALACSPLLAARAAIPTSLSLSDRSPSPQRPADSQSDGEDSEEQQGENHRPWEPATGVAAGAGASQYWVQPPLGSLSSTHPALVALAAGSGPPSPTAALADAEVQRQLAEATAATESLYRMLSSPLDDLLLLQEGSRLWREQEQAQQQEVEQGSRQWREQEQAKHEQQGGGQGRHLLREQEQAQHAQQGEEQSCRPWSEQEQAQLQEEERQGGGQGSRQWSEQEQTQQQNEGSEESSQPWSEQEQTQQQNEGSEGSSQPWSDQEQAQQGLEGDEQRSLGRGAPEVGVAQEQQQAQQEQQQEQRQLRRQAKTGQWQESGTGSLDGLCSTQELEVAGGTCQESTMMARGSALGQWKCQHGPTQGAGGKGAGEQPLQPSSRCSHLAAPLAAGQEPAVGGVLAVAPPAHDSNQLLLKSAAVETLQQQQASPCQYSVGVPAAAAPQLKGSAAARPALVEAGVQAGPAAERCEAASTCYGQPFYPHSCPLCIHTQLVPGHCHLSACQPEAVGCSTTCKCSACPQPHLAPTACPNVAATGAVAAAAERHAAAARQQHAVAASLQASGVLRMLNSAAERHAQQAAERAELLARVRPRWWSREAQGRQVRENAEARRKLGGLAARVQALRPKEG